MEAQLKQFCESISPPLWPSESSLAKCNSVADSIFKMLQRSSLYKADRCKFVGGLGKKTSTAIIDADLVVFVNIEEPADIVEAKKKILSDWSNIIVLQTTGLRTSVAKNDIRITPHSLQFIFDGVDVDLLPAINFSPDVSVQKDRVMAYIKKSRDPVKTSSNVSAELTELAVKFLKSKSNFCHNIARLAKYWVQTIPFPDYISGKSSMMEMIGVKAALDEEQRSPQCPNYGIAFKAFLKMIEGLQAGDLLLIFEDFYKHADIPENIRSQKPLLLDPTNPYNNFISTSGSSKERQDSTRSFLKVIGERAVEASKILSVQPFQLEQLFK